MTTCLQIDASSWADVADLGKLLSAADRTIPLRTEVSGAAGDTWDFGDGTRISMGALDFCRAVSGRDSAPGLLSQQVPF